MTRLGCPTPEGEPCWIFNACGSPCVRCGKTTGGLVYNDDTISFVLHSIRNERVRQETLKEEGRFKYTPDEVPLVRSHAMLSEECGEVARCALAVSGYVQEDSTLDDCFKELIQVAAVATAMAEGILLDNRSTLLGIA